MIPEDEFPNDEFTNCLFELADRMQREAGYNPTAFRGMLREHGGVETCKRLINAREPSQGYTQLWERNHLGLTVEAYILDNERWHSLFTSEELENCRRRLEEYGHFEN